MSRISSHTIYHSNFIDLVHDACKLCYKGRDEESKEKKLNYIEKKIKVGHESVIEHSNIIILLDVNGELDFMEDYAEILEASPYLRCKFEKSGDSTYYLFSGSIRAYKNIFRNMSKPFNSNMLLKSIMAELYYVPKEFFYDFIEAGIMEHSRFKDLHETFILKEDRVINNEYFDIEYIDDISVIKDMIDSVTGRDVYSIDTLMDMNTISIYFKKMSRIISQQLTRHRNAISQKSQRYVDEEGARWTNPLDFKDYIDKDKEFDVMGGAYNLDEIAEIFIETYEGLRDQGVTKEDARYILPQNTNTELYVTFTYRNLLHFLELRCDTSAQAEIRTISQELLNSFETLFDIEGESVFKYLIPKYMLSEAGYDIDELISEDI